VVPQASSSMSEGAAPTGGIVTGLNLVSDSTWTGEGTGDGTKFYRIGARLRSSRLHSRDSWMDAMLVMPCVRRRRPLLAVENMETSSGKGIWLREHACW